MFKPSAFKIILFLVLGGGLYVVAANSHMDIFPCEVVEKNFTTGKLEQRSTVCSLLAVNRLERNGEKSELTVAGYVVAVLFFGGVSAIAGFGIGHLIERKKKQPAA